MKVKLLVIQFLFFFSQNVNGQADRIKLLDHDLKLAKTDTHKIKLINEIVGLLNSNIRMNEIDKYLKEGLKLSENIKDKYWKASIYENYGLYYEKLGEYDKSKVYFEKALEIHNGKNDDRSRASSGTCWVEIGAIYNKKGNLKKGIEYNLKGADAWEASNLQEKYLALGNIYGNIANMFFQNNQLDKALQYDLKGVKIREKGKNNSVEDAKAYMYLSMDYSGFKKYDSAAIYLKKGKILVDKLKVPVLTAEYDRIFAKLYYDQKKYAEALPYGLEALEIGYQIKDHDAIRNSHNILTKIYLAKNIAKEALAHSQAELLISRKQKSNKNIMIALFNLSKVENRIGLHKEAYTHLLEYKVLKDSVFSSAEKLKLNEIEAKYNGAQKQNEILQKTIALEKSSNNMKLLGGGFGLLSLLAGLGFYSYKKKEKAKTLETELQTQRTERQRIASEMHDELGGNLTSLMYLAHNLKDKSTKNDQVDKIIQTSGNISESINEIVWALNQEQNQLADWVMYVRGKTAEMLENASVQYSFDISETIPERTLSNLEKRNLYLVVKEAINNALKHSNASEYSVSMNFETGIDIKIRDNGQGFVENGAPKTGGGNGLKNMKSRMEEIGGTIDWRNGQGTTVDISLT
ncbi:MAG: tetratricopeptide repeat-containing sensor histidine kinase [Leadbetterella sp.]